MPLARGEREKMPNRRRGWAQKVTIGGKQKVHVRSNAFPDGRPAEVFIDMSKDGAAFRAVMKSLAISVSIGLQYGAPLREFIDAFGGMNFEPNGVVEGEGSSVTECESVL